MVLPTLLQQILDGLGIAVRSVTPLTGGIHPAAHVETGTGNDCFVKWRVGGEQGPFYQEARGLEYLASTRAFLIPVVYSTKHFTPLKEGDASFDYLLMEYVTPSTPTNADVFRDRFAEALATLHRHPPADGQGYGLSEDNFIGHLPQPNLPRTTDWPTFYRDNRLLPQIGIAKERGLLNPERERLLMSVVEQLPQLLGGMPNGVSLLHGDLWSGNFICAAGDEPVLIDPAAYYGHREVELAFIELFGGFPPGFVAAYESYFPLDEGYLGRRALHQLYPLLTHLNHFGERYGLDADRVCRAYLAGRF